MITLILIFLAPYGSGQRALKTPRRSDCFISIRNASSHCLASGIFIASLLVLGSASRAPITYDWLSDLALVPPDSAPPYSDI